MATNTDPSAKVYVREDGRATVVPPVEVDLYTAARLRADLTEAGALTKNGDIVVDMAAVVFFDSSGLGALIAAYKRARDNSPRGHVYLVAVPDRIRDVLAVTGTAKLFRLASNFAELPLAREASAV